MDSPTAFFVLSLITYILFNLFNITDNYYSNTLNFLYLFVCMYVDMYVCILYVLCVCLFVVCHVCLLFVMFVCF